MRTKQESGLRSRKPSQPALDFPARLTEKYCPVRLADFIGMEKPRRVLASFAAAPRSDAFLFVGASGLGKTSMALAFASELGAEVHHIASQKCTVESIEEVVRTCWYVPQCGGFHLVLVDEADRMSYAAQLALLSKLDATEPPPQTIWVFTANETGSLEKRFLSRCKVLEFEASSVNGDLLAMMRRIWQREAPEAPVPDFALIENDARGNVRDALNKLEVELMAA